MSKHSQRAKSYYELGLADGKSGRYAGWKDGRYRDSNWIYLRHYRRGFKKGSGQDTVRKRGKVKQLFKSKAVQVVVDLALIVIILGLVGYCAGLIGTKGTH